MTTGYDILKVTNGTNTVNLLDLKDGYAASDWRQGIAQYKGGGVWTQSAISAGSRLAAKQFDLVTENIPIPVATAGTQDILARMLENLILLAEQASDYWTERRRLDPVWLVARAHCETNTRYAMIHRIAIPDVGDVLGFAFTDSGTLIDLTAYITRGHWTENEPGTNTAIELSAVEAYDGRNLGNVDSTGTRDPTTDRHVFFTNKRLPINLTDVYTWSAANGFSANLMDAAVPFNLIDDVGAAPAVNDYIAFGVDTTLMAAGAGPFDSLVFDIGTGGAGYTGHWEFWDSTAGPGWANLTVNGPGGEAFTATGVTSYHWNPSANWVTNAVNLITGFWVRWVIDTLPGGFVVPTQQSRDIYAIAWPYVEVQSTEIPGNIDALIRLLLANEGTSTARYSNQILVALRSVSRGEDFTAYLNAAPQVIGQVNPTGIAVDFASPVISSIADPTAPTGFHALYNPLGVRAMEDGIGWSFSPTAATEEWYGVYRAFVRYMRVGGTASDIVGEFVMRLGSYYTMWTSKQFTFPGTNPFQVIDIGSIEIPSSVIRDTEEVDEFRMYVRLQCTVAAAMPDIIFYDLILLPIDEWVGDFNDIVRNGSYTAVTGARYYDIDSILYPKRPIRTMVKNQTDDEVELIYQVRAERPLPLHPYERQRYWFFCLAQVSTHEDYLPTICHSAQAYRTGQYLALRGAR